MGHYCSLTEEDDAIDVIFHRSFVLSPGVNRVVTDLYIRPEKGFKLKLFHRSNATNIPGLIIQSGIIDSSYCGTLKATMINNKSYHIKIPEKSSMIQLLVEKVEIPIVMTHEDTRCYGIGMPKNTSCKKGYGSSIPVDSPYKNFIDTCQSTINTVFV